MWAVRLEASPPNGEPDMSNHSRIFVGVGGWTYAPWRGGVFYPKGLPQARELAFAAEKLTSIEINGTFYRLQSAESFRRWASETPESFIFSLKAHRVVTYRRKLAEAGEAIERFLASGVTQLGARLGAILWQLPPTKSFDGEDIKAFLNLLPDRAEGLRLRHALEVRHQSFQDPRFPAMLRERNVALCCSDNVKFPLFDEATADFHYLRLQNSAPSQATGYAPRDLHLWAERLKAWAMDRDCFVYLIAGAKERAPAAACALIERLAGGV